MPPHATTEMVVAGRSIGQKQSCGWLCLSENRPKKTKESRGRVRVRQVVVVGDRRRRSGHNPAPPES
ncbi:hypothetical protein HanXRQr2_Chr08g0346381 [Helianthus annuus]|uniref:Uncharacterized protein n=1 Tax=Helianthus annuus TaxID=4232 RepID=A0A9K3NDQ5_HELAN|nr:hypothetical protein HanXRQr2_Chr08g0346381 [Helianthus annuus]KAJ0902250.1 hypothetical protein HanPSC8_Chr08g0334811 [Helianthus annuus]